MSVTSPRGGKYRLSDMELDFVSLVPAGDDPSAVVVIAKTEPDPEKRGVGESTGTILSSNSDMEGSMGTINKADLSPEVLEYIEALESEVGTLGAQIEKAEEDINERDEQIAKMAPKDAESAEEIAKSMLAKADPAVRSLIEKQQAELAEVRKQAADEREARLTREYIAKAEDLSMVAEDKPSLASLLRAAAEKLEPEQNETLEKVLKSADEALRQSGLFSEFGKSETASTVSKSVEGKAEELRKADPSLTIEQAMERVYAENPDLFEQAMSESTEG